MKSRNLTSLYEQRLTIMLVMGSKCSLIELWAARRGEGGGGGGGGAI